MTGARDRKAAGRRLLFFSSLALLLVGLLLAGRGYVWLRAEAVSFGRWIVVGPDAVSGPVRGASVEFWRLPRTDMRDVFITSWETRRETGKPVHVGRNHIPIADAGGFWILQR